MQIFEITLRGLTVRPLLDGHPDLPMNARLVAQLYIDGDFVNGTISTTKEPGSVMWKFPDILRIQTNFKYILIKIIDINIGQGNLVQSLILDLDENTLTVLSNNKKEILFKVYPNQEENEVPIEITFSLSASLFLSEILGGAIATAKGVDQTAIDSTDPQTASELKELGDKHKEKYVTTHSLDDLHQAIGFYHKAVQLTNVTDPMRPAYLNFYGYCLSDSFEEFGDISALSKAIVMFTEAMELTSDGNPSKAAHMASLGSALTTRFLHSGDLNDLTSSILLKESVVNLILDGHPAKPGYLSNLGSSLMYRFQNLGNLSDIHNSVSAFEKALSLLPDGNPDKPTIMSHLGDSLEHLFQRLGNLADINKSVVLKEASVDLTPEDHPQRPVYLTALGNALMHRFQSCGNLSDINRSIVVKEEAVNLLANSQDKRYKSFVDLGNSLMFRFLRLGDSNDLKRAILMQEQALNLLPDGHPDKPSCLNSLGISLSRLFERFKKLDDLDKSIVAFEDSVSHTPESHPDKAIRLNNLGNSLVFRYKKLGIISDLDKSIVVLEKAVELTEDNHPSKAALLTNLGASLTYRFEKLDDFNDINKSILVREQATKLVADSHPNKADFLNNLGVAFHNKFIKSGDQADIETSVHNFFLAASLKSASASTRFQAAMTAAIYTKIYLQRSPFDAYEIAIQILPELVWLGLSISDRHHFLSKAGEVVRCAAAAAIEVSKYDTAIEWLEQGRSIIWGQLLQLRTPFDDLRQQHPELAEDLEKISQRLESPMSSQKSVPQSHDIVHSRELILQKIRSMEGFNHFLLPKRFCDLIFAAKAGPVITVNCSVDGSDALILMPGLGEIVHIPLEKSLSQTAADLVSSFKDLLRSKKVLREADRAGQLAPANFMTEDGESKFKFLLSQLWISVVKPVLDGMSITTVPDLSEKLPHIWWCLTGPLAFLPIHAAGLYGREFSDTGNKLSDFAVSSYIPSLTAFINAQKPLTVHKEQMLAVALPEKSKLPGAAIELKKIEEHIGTFPLLKLIESNATVEQVSDGMKESGWVHFACHGIQDMSNPTDSALLLSGDSKLTLAAIANFELPHAEFAFLSACQTATGTENLAEEAMHLSAGMMLAGYHGVIGTRWSIADNVASEVADTVYGHLFKQSKPDVTQAAYALHMAVKKLQERGGSFFSWVPFIHFGV